MQRQITEILALAVGVAAVIGGVLATVPARAADRQDLGELATRVQGFAGMPPHLDPRLILPACAVPSLGWAVPGHSVAVVCDAPAWRINVPVDAPIVAVARAIAPEPPAIRRGDRVTVEAGGQGFMVAIEAVAEADAAQGRIRLKNAASGAHLTGALTPGGQVVLTGLSPVVNSR